jgi:hypothetical protein
MIVCIDISQRTKDELDRLLEKGGYRDYSEAVAVAIANQVLLHNKKPASPENISDSQVSTTPPASASRSEATESAASTTSPEDSSSVRAERFTFPMPLDDDDIRKLAIAIGWPKGSSMLMEDGKVTGCVAHRGDVEDFIKTRKGKWDVLAPKSGRKRDEVPATFRAIGSDVSGVKTAPLPNDTFVTGQEVPVDRWIFGQHNKLLPAKATCRALANLLLRDSASREGIPLENAASEIALEAAMLGDFLRHIDKILEGHRDDALAFAFPYSNSRNGDKSRLRYANQFVASLSKNGLLTGLPVELKLVNRNYSRTPRLLLTEAGWNFAKLLNPILDAEQPVASPRFSGEEVEFIIQHIKEHVPAEDFAFRCVLDAVTEGATKPEALDDSLERFLPKRVDKPYKRAFLTTQRAGVVSRLIDLGLMQRLRDGINVNYSLTEKGSEYLGLAVSRG